MRDRTAETGTALMTATGLHDFAAGVLRAIGMTQDDAGLGARAMVWSELRGAPTQGVSLRLAQAVARARGGSVNPSPSWTVVRETPSSALLDADRGWGQVAGTRAMLLAAEKAGRHGVGMTSVRNADITAAMGWYAEVAVRERMIGLAINNTGPLMAPWGGTTKLLGNQAFAIGSPAGRHRSILFDSAVSAMSNSGIDKARQRGDTLPPDVALDRFGRPTNDPAEALAGILLPMGGHRGYGLALMWEVLTGVLSGGRMAPDIAGPSEPATPIGLSLLCLAVDPTAVMPHDTFVQRVDRLIDTIHSSAPADPADPVRVPGERGNEISLRRQRDGIPLAPEAAARLRALGDELGVPWPG
jgi:LDH2 family malate/lactate/ureidoglycolate dehydrogenase